MGGKDKKGPRTKGNMKPSSSGRSAELLGFVPEFVGFSGLPEVTFVPAVGTTSLAEDTTSDLAIPADFRLSMRKMGKKDSVTKIKALQEFSELCEQSSVDTLKNLLPFWPRIFTRLVVDGDRRVRENVHKSHFLLTNKIGRNLAPILKEIMGAWFTSQCDTYAPAASLASQSLTKCFAGKKLTEAIVFCHNDIIIYILDSLFKEDNYSDDQRERIRIGGIAGYSLLLQQVNSKIVENESFMNQHKELWENPSIFKMVRKDHSLNIKQAWFEMVYSFLHYLPQIAQEKLDDSLNTLFEETSSKVIASMSVFLNDPESTSQPAFWETVLKLCVVAEDDSSCAKFLLKLTPKFIDLLQKACFGNANKIGPLIVPCVRFLRNLPDNSIQPHAFDEDVIAALFQGLLSRNVSFSSIEASALSDILFQLLAFIFQTTNDSDHLNHLFLKQVIPSIELLIKPQFNDSIFTTVARHLTNYLNSLFIQDEKTALIIWELLERFIFDSLVQSPHPETEVFEKVGLFILVLMDAESKLTSNKKLVKRFSRLRFADPHSNENPIDDEMTRRTMDMSEEFRRRVVNMSVSLCKNALSCCETRDCGSCLHLLVSLTGCEFIANGFISVEDESEKLLNSVTTLLLRLPDRNTCTLFFIFLDIVPNGLKMLDNFSLDEDTCKTLAITAFENPDIITKQTVLEWLRGSCVSNVLVSAAGSVLDQENDLERLWKLIRSVLRARRSHPGKSCLEPVISQELIDTIMEVLIQNLNAEELNYPIDDLINQLCTTIKSIPDVQVIIHPFSKWLNALVEVLCSSICMESKSFNHLLDLWKTGTTNDACSRCESAITRIKQILRTNPDFVVVQRLVQVFDKVYELESEQSNGQERSSSVVHRILIDHNKWTDWIDDSSSACHLMAKEIATGNYCHVLPAKETFKQVQTSDWSGLLKAAYVISSIATRYEMLEQNEAELIPFVYYASAVSDLLIDINKKRAQDSDIKELEIMANVIDNNAQSLLSRCSSSQQKNVLNNMIGNSIQQRWVWCYAARKLQGIQVDTLPDKGKNLVDVTNIPGLLPKLLDIGTLNRHAHLEMTNLSSLSTDSFMESSGLIAAIRLILNQLSANADSDTLDAVSVAVQTLQRWQSEHDEHFLFGIDLKEANRKGSPIDINCVWTVIESIRFLSTVVELYPHRVEPSSWDFIFCSMSSWCTTLEESWSRINSSRANNSILLSFTVALCSLVDNCGRLVGKVEENPDKIPANLVSEWNDVFSEAAYNAVLPLFLQISRSTSLLDVLPIYLLEALALSIHHVPAKNLTSVHSQHVNVDSLSLLLMSEQPSIQFAVHDLIFKMLSGIASKEAKSSKEEIDNDQEKNERSPPRALLYPVEKAALHALENVRPGDLHTVEPYSSESTQILGFLLGWDLILQLCGCSDTDLRYQYASYLGNSKLISRLMDNLFCIIPHATIQQPIDLDREFRADLTLSEKVIQDLAVKVYSSALRYLPVVVRRWCNNTDKRTASLVEKFTARCVSPVLSALDLQFCCKTWDNMTVRVRPNAREVVATYKLNEEGSMELVMQLPTNYPLGNIIVETGRKVGVTSNQWRSWILQLQTFLMQQNGSILDGLTLWKQNVDKKFEGIEECYICYYVLHGSNYQLPKLSCRTCKKKFHSNCLYQWFSTSNNSTCPLCRNLF